MRVRNIIGVGLSAAATLAVPPAFATCSVDGSGGYTSPITTNSSYGFGSPSTLCGHTVTGTSGCVVNVTVADSSVGSGDCFTIGKGVVLNVQGHGITCTAGAGSTCGKGITVSNSGGGSDKVEINDAVISGHWTDGIHATTGTNLEIDTVNIDLGGDGVNGVTGPVKTISASKVKNGSGDCIATGCSTTVSDTFVSFCDGLGIETSACTGSVHSVVDHCFIHDNGYAVRNNYNLLGDIVIRDSTIYNNDCNYQSNGTPHTCQGSPQGINFATPSFVDDDIVD